MSTFDFVRPSGQWSVEMVPGANDYYGWDWRQSRIINGDDGGTWAPTSPIVVGGAGIEFAAPTSVLSGGLQTALAGRLILGTYDIIGLAPARTITRTVDLVSVLPATVGLTVNTKSSGSGNTYTPPMETSLAIQEPGNGSPGGLVPSGTVLTEPIVFTIPTQYLINGRPLLTGGVAPNLTNAVLTAVTLNFRFLSRPATLPAPLLNVTPFSGMLGTNPPIPASELNALFGPLTLVPWDRFNFFFSNVPNYVTQRFGIVPPFSYFKCIQSGVTGPFEPAWDLTPGTTTNDGSIVWLCIGGTGDLYATTPDQYYNNGDPQSITAAMDPVVSPNLDVSNNYVQVGIFNVPNDGSILLHSLQFTFTNMTTLGWT